MWFTDKGVNVFKNDYDAKWSLKDLGVIKEELANGCYTYFLSATYEVENRDGVYKVNIPSIILPIGSYPDISTQYGSRVSDCKTTIDLGFGELEVGRRVGQCGEKFYTVEKIKDKVHEMTLDEIEKKLGYKVKIVNKED